MKPPVGAARAAMLARKPPAGTVTNGLLVWYKLNEGSGSTAYDFADSYADSTAQDGTINGATWTTTAKTGEQALDFDGTDDNINSNYSSFIATANWTITAWAKISPKGAIASTYGSSNPSLQLYTTSSDTLAGVINDGTDSIAFETGSTFNTNTWKHFSMIRDSSTLRIFVNGELDVEKTNTNLDTDLDNGVGLTIGSQAGGFAYLPGQIDDVRIYDRALSQTDIQTIYDNTV